MPEANHICLDFGESTPRQIQDIYSGMPCGHTVGGGVVARLPSFLPVFSASCLFLAEKRRG